MRFDWSKVHLKQILERYTGTPFEVAAAGSLTTVLKQEPMTIRAWAEPDKLVNLTAESPEAVPASVFVELAPADAARISGEPKVSFPQSISELGLKIVDDVTEVSTKDVRPPLKDGTRRFTWKARPDRRIKPGVTQLPLEVGYTLEVDGSEVPGQAATTVLLQAVDPVESTVPSPGAATVGLVGGVLHMGLGHLCPSQGCADHFYRSSTGLAGLVGIRPSPSHEQPEATAYLRAAESIDVWKIREKLREQGVEVRRLVPHEIESFQIHVELPRWHARDDESRISQCASCRELALGAATVLPWTERAKPIGTGVTIQPHRGEVELVSFFDKLDAMGIVPMAVWLTPSGATMPKAAAPQPGWSGAHATKSGGSDTHPLIQFDFGHICAQGPGLLGILSAQAWASRTGCAGVNLGSINPLQVLPGAAGLAAIGDRQRADLMPLLRSIRESGQRPTQLRLSGFGDLRIEIEFAHLCGEVEYSKPPKEAAKKKEGEEEKPPADGGSEKSGETKSEAKPFVPRPLRPAESSPARQAIERAIAQIGAVNNGTFHPYHTKPEFNGPRKLFIALGTPESDVVQLDELTQVLTRAGFPPIGLRVSRLFPGIPFGHALPPDLELTSASGEPRSLKSFKKNNRPLAVVFVSLNCPKWDKYQYEAKANLFTKLRTTVLNYKDRVDFVAISSNPDDAIEKVVELLGQAELEIPLLADRDGRAKAVFNAQITPPPHLYVFDGNGLLRYAGDAHSQWNKPEEEQKDFLGPALDSLLAGKFADNGAVSFRSHHCNCSSPNCKCPKCGCGPSCRCDIGH